MLRADEIRKMLVTILARNSSLTVSWLTHEVQSMITLPRPYSLVIINVMELSHTWETNSPLSCHDPFIETAGQLPYSQEPNTSLYMRQANPIHIIRPYLSKPVSHLRQGLSNSLSLSYFLISPIPATGPADLNLLVFYIFYYRKISTYFKAFFTK
jgi:hypothetical protein